MAPVEKALWLQWKIRPWFIAPMEKAWFYEKFFFKVVVVVVMVKVLPVLIDVRKILHRTTCISTEDQNVIPSVYGKEADTGNILLK